MKGMSVLSVAFFPLKIVSIDSMTFFTTYLWLSIWTTAATGLFVRHRVGSGAILDDIVGVILSLVINVSVLIWSYYFDNWQEDVSQWEVAFVLYLDILSFITFSALPLSNRKRATFES